MQEWREARRRGRQGGGGVNYDEMGDERQNGRDGGKNKMG